jgi:hypothetical protein
MKFKSLILFMLIAPAVIFLSQGCDKCKESGTITIDGAAQYFEATYLVDSNGANYATSVWRPNGVGVLLSTNGKFGPFAAISEDLSDGKIGPFKYSTSPATAQKGRNYDYMYIVNKDTFGTDTFEVGRVPRVLGQNRILQRRSAHQHLRRQGKMLDRSARVIAKADVPSCVTT